MCTGFLVKEPEGQKPLGDARYRWKDNIKVALKVKEFDDMDCVHLTKLRHSWWGVYNMEVNVRIA